MNSSFFLLIPLSGLPLSGTLFSGGKFVLSETLKYIKTFHVKQGRYSICRCG